MSDLELSNEPNLKIKTRLIAKGEDKPVTGAEYSVRLYDKDDFDQDDFLGESSLDANGVATITCSHETFSDTGIFKESQPDFYFVVMKNGATIFTSKVMEDVNLSAAEYFKMGEGEVIDLGTFLIDA
jgi:hypothetical protein